MDAVIQAPGQPTISLPANDTAENSTELGESNPWTETPASPGI